MSTQRQALARGQRILSEPLLPAEALVRLPTKTRSPSPTTSTCRRFDPTVGASAVNPTIQSLYQAIFDPYVGQKPDLTFKPGLLTNWGWNDDKTKVDMDGARGRHLAQRRPGHRRGRRLVAGARRQRRDRQPDPVRLVEDRQLQDRRQQDHRRRPPVRADLLQVDGASSPATSCRRSTTRASGPRASREAGRLRPLHGRRVPAERLPAPQGQPELLGRQAGLRHRGLQVRPRSHEPRRRDRVRLLRRHARDPLRGVRPAEARTRTSPATPRRSPTSR